MSATEAPIGIVRADHTGFTVSSLPEALHFWVDVLGFRHLYTNRFEKSEFLDNVVGVRDAELSLAMVQSPGGHMIELLEYVSPVDRNIIKPRSCDVGSVLRMRAAPTA